MTSSLRLHNKLVENWDQSPELPACNLMLLHWHFLTDWSRQFFIYSFTLPALSANHVPFTMPGSRMTENRPTARKQGTEILTRETDMWTEFQCTGLRAFRTARCLSEPTALASTTQQWATIEVRIAWSKCAILALHLLAAWHEANYLTSLWAPVSSCDK